jgi:hypothetical protein
MTVSALTQALLKFREQSVKDHRVKVIPVGSKLQVVQKMKILLFTEFE